MSLYFGIMFVHISCSIATIFYFNSSSISSITTNVKEIQVGNNRLKLVFKSKHYSMRYIHHARLHVWGGVNHISIQLNVERYMLEM